MVGVSAFQITITRVDGKTVHLRPNAQGVRDLVADIVKRVGTKGVGVFRTEARVLKAVEESVIESLNELKSEVLPGE